MFWVNLLFSQPAQSPGDQREAGLSFPRTLLWKCTSSEWVLTSLLLPSFIRSDKQTAEQLVFKMRGFLVLLSVLLVLEKTQGNETYEQLNPHKRGIVDKAIKRANGEFGNQHLDYSSILKPVSCLIQMLIKPLVFYCYLSVCLDDLFSLIVELKVHHKYI